MGIFRLIGLAYISPSSKMNEYQWAAFQLRIIHTGLTRFLERAKAEAHKDMKEVSPGIWIHKDYKDLGEACEFLRSLLPNE